MTYRYFIELDGQRTILSDCYHDPFRECLVLGRAHGPDTPMLASRFEGRLDTYGELTAYLVGRKPDRAVRVIRVSYHSVKLVQLDLSGEVDGVAKEWVILMEPSYENIQDVGFEELPEWLRLELASV